MSSEVDPQQSYDTGPGLRRKKKGKGKLATEEEAPLVSPYQSGWCCDDFFSSYKSTLDASFSLSLHKNAVPFLIDRSKPVVIASWKDSKVRIEVNATWLMQLMYIREMLDRDILERRGEAKASVVSHHPFLPLSRAYIVWQKKSHDRHVSPGRMRLKVSD